MKHYLKISKILIFIFFFSAIGCKTAGQNVQHRQPTDPVTVGQQMVQKVFTDIRQAYIDTVHPHRLLVSSVQGIEKKFNDSSLLAEISGDIRVMSS